MGPCLRSGRQFDGVTLFAETRRQLHLRHRRLLSAGRRRRCDGAAAGAHLHRGPVQPLVAGRGAPRGHLHADRTLPRRLGPQRRVPAEASRVRAGAPARRPRPGAVPAGGVGARAAAPPEGERERVNGAGRAPLRPPRLQARVDDQPAGRRQLRRRLHQPAAGQEIALRQHLTAGCRLRPVRSRDSNAYSSLAM